VANVSNSFLNIGLISVFVRRANIKFDPTLVLLIGLIPVFVRRANIKFAPTLVLLIGLIPVFVRRANTRFAPTLVLLIGLILVFVRRANTRFAPTLVLEIGWISITTIYPKIYDRLLSNTKYKDLSQASGYRAQSQCFFCQYVLQWHKKGQGYKVADKIAFLPRQASRSYDRACGKQESCVFL